MKKLVRIFGTMFVIASLIVDIAIKIIMMPFTIAVMLIKAIFWPLFKGYDYPKKSPYCFRLTKGEDYYFADRIYTAYFD